MKRFKTKFREILSESVSPNFAKLGKFRLISCFAKRGIPDFVSTLVNTSLSVKILDHHPDTVKVRHEDLQKFMYSIGTNLGSLIKYLT
jgi:hypothetical protein